MLESKPKHRLRAGRIFRYSPLSRIVALEALASGVMAKLRLWQSLSLLTDVDTSLDEDALLGHIADARSQLDTIGRLHATAVEVAFKRLHASVQ